MTAEPVAAQPSAAMRPRTARTLRLAVAGVGVLLMAASRLPWFTVDVEALQIVENYFLSDDVMRSLIGYRVGSDRLIILLLGILIAITGGLWAWRAGLLLARPLLLTFSGIAAAWSTLAFFEVGTVPSESNAIEAMTASIGPVACVVLALAAFVLTLIARVGASDLPALRDAIDRAITRSRMPVAAVLSRRALVAAQRDLGPGHPETLRAAIAHADGLLLAGFPTSASSVLSRIEARPELANHPEDAEAVHRLRQYLTSIINDDGTPRPDFMGR